MSLSSVWMLHAVNRQYRKENSISYNMSCLFFNFSSLFLNKKVLWKAYSTSVLCRIFEKRTESAWIPSSAMLLNQPYPSGRTCYPFVGWRTHSGLSLPRLRKGILLRQPSLSTSQAEVFRHRWSRAELVLIVPVRSILPGPNRRRPFWGGSLS